MELKKRIADHVGMSDGKFYKTTLFRSQSMLLGLNCLESGQVQAAHAHAGQDKFYLVVDGYGRFVVAEEEFIAGPGAVIWAPAGIDHGVANDGQERLTLLVCIAPAP